MALAPPRAERDVHLGPVAADVNALRIFVPHASDYFTDHRPHGDGLVAFEFASRLAQRGHDVHLMAPQIDVRGAVPQNLHLHPLPAPIVPGIRGRIAYMTAVRATYARLRRTARFDVIHQLNPVFAGMSLALADARVPVVLGPYVGAWPSDADTAGIMGTVDVPFAAGLRRMVAAVQQRLAAALILTTPAAEPLIVNIDRDRHKIFAIPHGIDPKPYGATDVAARDGAVRTPTILFLGGTERRKGIYVLLEAFRTVHAAMPAARLVIAGGGGREHSIRAAVDAMPERDSIELLGVVERPQVPGLMARASVFAAPSNGEPFGLALLEAMASAKPVVVTDAGGPAHIVDAAGGFKVPVGDASALARALLEVLQAPERAAAMGEYNRLTIERTYAWDRVMERLDAVYARVLAGRATP